MPGPRKIAILGGGIAALTTAWELSSQAGWQERLEITVYQLGWRLGGKCATGRGPNGRIQEHGIHGFLGSYYNALPLMVDVYRELGRAPGTPLATFEEAFKRENFVLMWQCHDGRWHPWTFSAPGNALRPDDAQALPTVEHWLQRLVQATQWLFEQHVAQLMPGHGLIADAGRAILKELLAGLDDLLGDADRTLSALSRLGAWLRDHAGVSVHLGLEMKRLHITIDFMLALARGTIADDIARRGFDVIDDEDFAHWLTRHGAGPDTVSSPLALNTPNLSYQYPMGDTTRPATMAAGAYLHWTLRSFAYLGSFAWLFEAGTGETVIAPLYEVLRRRGVRFEFFQKVTELQPSADGQDIAAVQIDVQATLKHPAAGYQPLIDVKGLPAWPAEPLFEQLEQGVAMQTAGVDLESYWTAWQPVHRRTMVAGQDFDQLVFAISIGAVPHLCGPLLAQKPAWQRMVQGVPAVQTQSMQLWFDRSTPELGWTIPMLGPTDIVIGATFANPIDGQVDFTHLIRWEEWPASNTPRALWYFSGAMDGYEPPPPFSDHGYPQRQAERVKWQCIQYLQATIGALLPQATTDANHPPGDPIGLDFSLLAQHDQAQALQGTARFGQQFWRANIDPTERYVTSPPGSTKCRLPAWGSGYANLVLAGDWIYTGLNVGSVEGTVMSGKLASHAICGAPALESIVGYPADRVRPPA